MARRREAIRIINKTDKHFPNRYYTTKELRAIVRAASFGTWPERAATVRRFETQDAAGNWVMREERTPVTFTFTFVSWRNRIMNGRKRSWGGYAQSWKHRAVVSVQPREGTQPAWSGDPKEGYLPSPELPNRLALIERVAHELFHLLCMDASENSGPEQETAADTHALWVQETVRAGMS
jgi:hypothetical protein